MVNRILNFEMWVTIVNWPVNWPTHHQLYYVSMLLSMLWISQTTVIDILLLNILLKRASLFGEELLVVAMGKDLHLSNNFLTSCQWILSLNRCSLKDFALGSQELFNSSTWVDRWVWFFYIWILNTIMIWIFLITYSEYCSL